MDRLSQRLITALSALIFGVFFIFTLQLLLGKDAMSARLLLDYGENNTVYPFSVQNLMWIIFFLGLGELLERFRGGRQELFQLNKDYLPEDETTILRLKHLGDIYQKVRRQAGAKAELFLPRLIHRVILQFNNSNSIEQANSLLNSSLDLYLHEIDLRYNMLRYIMWLIPTLGFIGTVIGITMALSYAGEHATDVDLLSNLTQYLAVAFYTTLLALLQAAVLVFFMHIVQAREERVLNLAGQYCLDNLVNRLYVE
ncbi:MotA/TolQ/ExbB proton channel family protein [Candidatus Venteria ishoeyi]|uniref:MotA/TolQ/ExbB proton channel family protein n=1 Tax=Candidatus Venteria ishoeyi TaxID=1899563 RepID=A0A1H6F7F7_9GAMM|nr:MotA/TolQ/ExbB proton channel family protein [Candidatus Venteria ishoeyi]SEH04885.1 MotA/TolQ/ExbB proton channel family protein [Candidatus Venteria ishoeyi]